MSHRVTRPLAWALLGLAAAILLARPSVQMDAAQNAVDPNAELVQDFENRIADYTKLHKSAEAKLPKLKKPTDSPEKIHHHEHELREKIVAERPRAVQGNVFTPAICAEFRRLIGIAYQADARRIRESLRSSEPGTAYVRVRVNKEYPDNMPLQTMPPSLLLNLPQLPPELEYRVVGRDLILRDIKANLIVDIVPRVIPK